MVGTSKWKMLALALLAAGLAHAAPDTITYQGVLQDGAGTPVTGVHGTSFALWTAAEGGSQAWSEAHAAVVFTQGAFSVLLGATAPLEGVLALDTPLWLEVTVDTGDGPQSYAPRIALSGAAYSFQAHNAARLEGMSAADLEAAAEQAAADAAADAVADHDADADAHPNLNISGGQITSGTIDNARLSMGPGSGLDADTIHGLDPDDLEAASEQAAADAVAAHNADANAHPNLNISGGQITSGTISNARLSMGPGSGLDADTIHGLGPADLEAASEQAAADAVTAHNADANAHQDIRNKIDTDLAAHDADGDAHPDIRAKIDNDLAAHNTDANAHANMLINGAQIAAGTVDVSRLPVGTGATEVAAGNHRHHSLDAANGSSTNQVFVNNSGNVGVGTTAPGQKLEVNGAMQFTGDNAVANQTTGVISRAPRVIRTTDPVTGCPPARPANTDLFTQTFTLTRSATVMVSGHLIRNAAGRVDLFLVGNGVILDQTITNTGTFSDWKSAEVQWVGVIGAGTHTLSLRSPSANVWGCGPPWGSINTVIYE